MKIRKIEDIPAINLYSGDTIELRYQEHDEKGKLITDRTLTKEAVGRSMIVDRVAIMDLEDGELKLLGMDDAIAGVFGTRS